MLALPPCDYDLTEPLVSSTITLQQIDVEPVGEAYEAYVARRYLQAEEVEEGEDLQKEEGEEEINKEKMNEKRKKHKEAIKNLVFKNHYQALGLEHLYFDATVEDVRKAYKIKVLLHHPDKFEEGGYDEVAKKQWLAIQDAYETLVDAEKKKKYDSTMEFDDSLPANKKFDDDEFYREFSACFSRNGLFSEKKPVPNLGDEKTPINKVLKFYEFWEGFKSWRDFTVEDEYDLDQAENRYERRYMERENKNLKKDLLRKEKLRIKKLVDLARQNDPRVIQYEKQEKERIEKIREEKRLEKLKRKEDEERRQQEALEAKRLKEQQEADEKKRKEDELKEVRRQKKNKLDLTKQLIAQKVDLPDYGPLFVDFFFEGVTPEEHDTVLAELSQDLPLEDMRERFRKFVAAVKERQNPANHKKSVPTPKESKLANMSKWSDEEIALLTKGILKYPAGIGGRWEKITDLIGGSKTIHEVTAMAKDLSIKNVRGEKNILSTMEEAIKEKNTAVSKPKSLHANSEPLPFKEEKQPAAPSPQDWSQAQQKQLEAALKKYPATLEKKERWTKISEAVEGKSAKECLDRVKEIREKLAKKAE